MLRPGDSATASGESEPKAAEPAALSNSSAATPAPPSVLEMRMRLEALRGGREIVRIVRIVGCKGNGGGASACVERVPALNQLAGIAAATVAEVGLVMQVPAFAQFGKEGVGGSLEGGLERVPAAAHSSGCLLSSSVPPPWSRRERRYGISLTGPPP